MISKKKFQKPIDIDAHFKYRCASCNLDHWISFNEAKTKNYKIVCDCGNVFKPKRIKTVKIVYEETSKPLQNKAPEPINNVVVLDKEILSKCVGLLTSYGFTNQEAENLIKQTYVKNPTNDCMQLIKNTLESIGVNNEQPSSIIV